jgi:pyruvyltransferase
LPLPQKRLRWLHGKNLTKPAEAFPSVELFYWSPSEHTRNFGDHLSSIIVSRMLSHFNHLLDEAVAHPARLLAVGSILHFAGDGDTIWGTGVNGKVEASEHTFRTLDVRAVRGPITREFLMARGIAVPEIYGDPALLLPRLFPGRFRASGQRPYVVVPNLHDLDSLSQESSAVSPLSAWNVCVERIIEASFVISSSLHGLVVAEAFGIPARYLRITETEHMLKYQDYVLGTGRSGIEAAHSIEEALEMGGMPAPVFDEEALLGAFPIDLWRDGRGAMADERAAS